MNLEKIEKLAEDALTSGHYEAAACLYLGLYEIAKLKSIDHLKAEPSSVTITNTRGTYETESYV